MFSFATLIERVIWGPRKVKRNKDVATIIAPVFYKMPQGAGVKDSALESGYLVGGDLTS